MSNDGVSILFPVGRLVSGFQAKTKNQKGEPLTNKDGTPATEHSFGVAFAKRPGVDFKQEAWGAKLLAAAQAAFPGGQFNAPTFAWKVTDGDSQIPNKKGNKPHDNENYRGNWIVWFSTRYAPKTVNAKGTAPVPIEAIKPGHYVQVLASVRGNGSTDSPGLFMNHDFVAHSGFGPEISVVPDASEVGFGNEPLPAGASATPVAGVADQTAPPPPPAGNPPPPPSTTLRDAAGGNPPPPPVSGPQPTAKANGATKEAMLGWPGWDEAALLREGYLA